jgi:hypothetical protein
MANSILPEHKYYGTNIVLKTGSRFTVWLGPFYEGGTEGFWPSERQAKKDGYNSSMQAYNDGFYSDSHYETQFCFEICEVIVEALNKRGV